MVWIWYMQGMNEKFWRKSGKQKNKNRSNELRRQWVPEILEKVTGLPEKRRRRRQFIPFLYNFLIIGTKWQSLSTYSKTKVRHCWHSKMNAYSFPNVLVMVIKYIPRWWHFTPHCVKVDLEWKFFSAGKTQ